MVDVNQFVSNLSGGNKQKVVLARWIGKDSDIVVLDSPTKIPTEDLNAQKGIAKVIMGTDFPWDADALMNSYEQYWPRH